MANVTVLGAGGSSTVTITLSSAENAALAQTALKTVSGFVTAGILEQQTYSGVGTIPAPSNILGGVIVPTAGNVGALTAQYVSAVVTATGNSTIIGPDNGTATVVSGDGANLTYANLSTKADITFGTGNNFLWNLDGATARFDAGGSVIQTDAGGQTNASVADGGVVIVQGAGFTTVNAEAGGKVAVAVQGASTVPVTVNGAASGGGELSYLALGGAGVINPGSANSTVYGNVGAGKVTVFGGASNTGKLTVVEGRGFFTGGSSGGNQLFTSTVAGSATLQGGGTGDLLVSQGANQFLIAGAGSETLSGFSVAASVGGSIFQSGGGNATIFGNSGGGNTFALGGGLTLVDGRNEAVLGGATGKANTYYSVADGGGHGISDFISGLDTFNMTLTTTVTGQTVSSLTFFTAGQSGSPFGSGSGTRMILTDKTTVDFFGVQVKNSDLT